MATKRTLTWVNSSVLLEALTRYKEGRLHRSIKLWIEQVLELNTPTAKRIQKWHDTVLRYEREGKTIEEEIYGPFRRVRTMWDLSQRGEQKPSLQVNNLTLDKLFLH